MIQLSGTYDNGTITLNKPITTEKPLTVLVTLVDEDVAVEDRGFTVDDFSFAKGREILKDLKSSLSDTVVEERRSYL